jgi:hypothetical protein
MKFVDGVKNDVVKVYVDGVLKHTGTSWEDYFRTQETNPTRTVDSILFRVSGTAAPATAGNGFLIDNLVLNSFTPDAVSVPEITTPANGAVVQQSNLTKVDWTDSTGTFDPFEYQYESFSDAAYSSLVYSSGWLTASEIATGGTPVGDYYLRVRARDTEGNVSAWSNGAANIYKITVVADVVVVGPPVNKDECKKGGWMTFNNPEFKNQGACVSYVASKGKSGNK